MGIAWSVVYYLNVSFSRLITTDRDARAVFFLLSITRISFFFCSKEFLFLCVLRKAALFYYGYPWALHITIFLTILSGLRGLLLTKL